MVETNNNIEREAERPWPELQDRPLPQFPLSLLPDVPREFCEKVAASFAVPIDYMACSVLGVGSSALHWRYSVQPKKNHNEPLNLYLGLCGESGTRKSSAMKIAMHPLEMQLSKLRKDRALENRAIQDRRELFETSLSQLKRRGKKNQTNEMEQLRREIEGCQDLPQYEVILTDPTPEAIAACMLRQDGKAILYTDEGQIINILCGAYQKPGSVANLDTVLKGFDNSMCNIYRKTDGPTYIEHASLALTVGLQPSMLKRLIGNDDLSDRGFSPRMLFFIPDTARRVDVYNLPDVPQSVIDAWNSLITRLALLSREKDDPIILQLTSEAYSVHLEFWQEVEDKKLTEYNYKGMNAWATKAHGKAARLAGILELMKNPDATFVEADSMRAAVTMMREYFTPHAQRVFGGPNDLSDEAQRILEAIKSKNATRVKVSDIRHDMSGQKRFKGESGKQLFDRAMHELEKQNYIRPLKCESKEGRGRPSGPEYEIHPDMYSQSIAKPIREGVL